MVLVCVGSALMKAPCVYALHALSETECGSEYIRHLLCENYVCETVLISIANTSPALLL